MGHSDAGAGRVSRSRRLWMAIAGLAVALIMVAWVGLALSGCTFEVGTKTTSTGSAITTSPSDTGAPSTVKVVSGEGLASPAQEVATILGPSVVYIAMSGTESSQGPFGGDSTYEYSGSGVIYTTDGMIVTNNHMVTDDYGDPADKIEVTLTTGEILPATIVGRDPLTDLAVIKVDAPLDLPAATFVDELPTVGEYSIAIGSPMGFENSVTLGIVSALNRNFPTEWASGTELVALSGLIQTDAAINHGNSGGALANASGQVIGINVASLVSVGAENMGFAIPSVVVTQVADQIISTGKASHAYLGVGTQTVTADLQRQFKLSRSSGVLVAEVTSQGPASKAGIQQGDIIIKIDDEEMIESSDVLMAIRDKLPGNKVQVSIDRNGTSMVITATLEERPANQ